MARLLQLLCLVLCQSVSGSGLGGKAAPGDSVVDIDQKMLNLQKTLGSLYASEPRSGGRGGAVARSADTHFPSPLQDPAEAAKPGAHPQRHHHLAEVEGSGSSLDFPPRHNFPSDDEDLHTWYDDGSGSGAGLVDEEPFVFTHPTPIRPLSPSPKAGGDVVISETHPSDQVSEQSPPSASSASPLLASLPLLLALLLSR